MDRDRKLDDLVEPFRTKIFEFLARCTENNIPVIVIETLRSEAQHQADLASGHSWIKRSKHQDGLAVDICPYQEYQENGPDKLDWNAESPLWLKLGLIGENLGLLWGGRWQQKDLGHFEYKAPNS